MMAEVTKPLKELASITPSFEQTVKPAQEKLAESTKAKAEVAGAEKAMLTQAEADRQKAYQQAGEAATQAVKTSPVFAQKEEVFKETNKPFIPTQDDAKDVAALYSLVNVVGMALGAGGKQNSMQAMHAMNGMLEGYQKGRQDLYKKEKDKFDVNMKNLKSRYDMLDKQLKDVMTLAQTDREAARQAADVAFAQSGANFYKQMADKIGIAGLYEYHKQAYDAANKLFAEQKRLEADADKRAHQKRMEDLAARRVALAEGKAVAGPSTKGGKGVSALNDRYAFNINESFSQAATDLLNVAQMPKNTVLGTFAGMTGQSGNTLLSSLENVVARAVTSEDSRLMQQIVAGLDQNMARALGGGYASSTSKGLIQAYKEQVAQYGDSALAQAMFLSRMKQELGILAKAFKNHPGSNEGYVRDMQEYMDALNKAIPFNVSDVIAANRGKKQTVTDKFSKLAQTPAVVPLPSSEGLVTEKATPAPVAAPTTKYDSAETVKNDYKSGKITKEQATSILVDQFGYKP
jgi:hypothetical protein